MAICPKCKKEIDYLDYCAVTHTAGVLEIDDELPIYDEDWHPLNEAEFTFDCPECSEELFTNDQEASDFLKKVLPEGADDALKVTCPSGQV